MEDPQPGRPSALEALAEALARQRAAWEREAQEAVAAALAERGRDPALARLIAGPSRPDPTPRA
jgi:hypothetical protein